MIKLKTNNCMVLVISSEAVLSRVAFLSTPKNHNQYQDGLHVGLVENMEGDGTDRSIARSFGLQRSSSGCRSMVLLDIRGVQKTRKVTFELAPKLIPFLLAILSDI